MKLRKVAEQREHETRMMMLAIGLECHLRNLMAEILAGDVSKISEFQEFIQFAPPSLNAKLNELLEGGAPC
jgi:hypothetical protein